VGVNTTPSSVLIAEDNTAACLGLAEFLKSAGYHVQTAADGVEALETLERQPPDLMLLDVWMPKMDGLQVLRELKTRSARPKVIVMTADDTPETVLLSLQQDAYQFISKPIEPKKLLEMVNQTMHDSTVLPSSVVISARPGWVELLVPCSRTVADRIEGFIANLDADLPKDVRATVGMVFRELLIDAMGADGTFDPKRRVRIACLRARRMLMYRIADAGYGFRAEDYESGAAPEAGSGVPAAAGAAGANGEGHLAAQAALLLRPGMLLAREFADELLVNEARNEVVFIKYLD
jgi:CheY-like chemotaxis protein